MPRWAGQRPPPLLLAAVWVAAAALLLPTCGAFSFDAGLRYKHRPVRDASPTPSIVDEARSHGGYRSGREAALEATEHERFEYCWEREELEESHGIRVATWRWNEVQVYYAITLFIVIAGLAKLAFHHAHFLSSKIPESCLLIILGIFMGIVTYHIRHRNDGHTRPVVQFENGTRIEPCEDEFSGFFPRFDAELFFLVLLPPIILEASYSLHDRTFADNLGTVLLFAVVGTLFNMFVIGPALWGIAVSGAMGSSMIPANDNYDIGQISLVQMLTFASLIVAVDPVAVLAIFQEVGVNKDLYFLVFGESLLNDAVTVVLYNAMVVFSDSSVDVTYDQILLAIVAFFCVSLGGLAIGVIFGLLTAIITKFTPDVRVVEPLSLLAMAYLSYLSAELVHFSGIIATVGCGVIQAHYAMKNISKNSYITIKYFITMASSTSDTIIFMFLGMVLISDDHEWHTGFALWTLLLCLVARFIGVYFLTWLANFRRLRRIGLKEQFIMAYGGLRGAVGFSLVFMLRDTTINPTTVRIFITTTLFIILFTVFIQGSTIKLLVNLFNIKLDEKDDPTLAEEITSTTIDHITAGLEEILGHQGANAFKERLDRFDDKYLKPFFISDSSDTNLARLYDKLVLDEHYANLYGPATAQEEHAVLSDTALADADFFLPEEDLVHLRRRSSALRKQMSQPTGPPSARAHPFSRMGSLRESFMRRWSSVSPHHRSVDLERAGTVTAPISPTTPGSFNPEDNYKTYPGPGGPRDSAMLRAAFNSNPYNKLHHRYNPNLIDDEEQELSAHLQRRHRNAARFSQIGQQLVSQQHAAGGHPSAASSSAMARTVSEAMQAAKEGRLEANTDPPDAVQAGAEPDPSVPLLKRRRPDGDPSSLKLHMPGVSALVIEAHRRALRRKRDRHMSTRSEGGAGAGAGGAGQPSPAGGRPISTPADDFGGVITTLEPIKEADSVQSTTETIGAGPGLGTVAESMEMLPRIAPTPAPRAAGAAAAAQPAWLSSQRDKDDGADAGRTQHTDRNY